MSGVNEQKTCLGLAFYHILPIQDIFKHCMIAVSLAPLVRAWTTFCNHYLVSVLLHRMSHIKDCVPLAFQKSMNKLLFILSGHQVALSIAPLQQDAGREGQWREGSA